MHAHVTIRQAVNRAVKDSEDRERLEHIQANLNTSACTGELDKYRLINVTQVRAVSPLAWAHVRRKTAS